MLYCICFCLFAVTFLLSHTAAVQFGDGECTVLPQTSDARRFNPCVNVVTYSFYLFPGDSLSQYQTNANAALNNSLLMQFPSFTSLYVNYVCSKIYLKCQPDVVLSDSTTYNFQVYSTIGVTYGIPFQIPCKSVCTNMLGSSPSVMKLLYSMSPTWCTSTYDYSYGVMSAPYPSRFDATNTAGQCFVPTTQVIGSAVEKYTGTFCKGIVDEVFIPPANKLLPTLAALQSPGVAQALVEFGLANAIKLPPFLAPDCHLALKQYMCYRGFARPEVVKLQHALQDSGLAGYSTVLNAGYPGITDTNFSVPSYAHRSYCTNYTNTCAKLIALTSKLPSNCSITVPGTATKFFPEDTQIVTTVTTTIGVVKFATKPTYEEYFNETELETYVPNCPSGFVVPEHPDDENVQWVEGTGCASACRSPLWEKEEWNMFERLANGFPAAGTTLGLLVLFYLIIMQEVWNYYLVFIYVLINLTASIKSLQFAKSGDLDERLCYDNAINQQQDYGNGSMCVQQAATLAYCILTSCGLILAIVIQWVLQSYRKKSIFYHPLYYIFQFIIIFVIPMIPVAYAGAYGEFGFSKSASGYCMLLPSPFAKENDNVALIGIPVFVGYVIAYLIFLGGVIARIYYPLPEAHPEDDLLHKVERQFDPYVMVVMFSALIFVPLIVGSFTQYLLYDAYLDSFMEWGQCVFLHYDGVSDESYVDDCGTSAKDRPAFALGAWQAFLLMGNLMLIGPIFIFFHLFQRNFDFVNLIRDKYGWKKISPESNIQEKFPAPSSVDDNAPEKAKEIELVVNKDALAQAIAVDEKI